MNATTAMNATTVKICPAPSNYKPGAVRIYAHVEGRLPNYLGNNRSGFCIDMTSDSVYRVTNKSNKGFWFEYQGDTITDIKTIIGYNIPGANKRNLQNPNSFKISKSSKIHIDNVLKIYNGGGFVEETITRIEHDEINNFHLEITEIKKTSAPAPAPAPASLPYEKKPSTPIRFTKDDFPVLGKK